MTAERRPYDAVKRGIDIVGAGTGLMLLSPVIGVTALCVRAKLGSPIIFKQERPGQDGKIFKLYKFRSMLNVDEAKGLVNDEERLTSFGKALRATSLDELPTLWNVLRGDMTVVGPRPLLVEYLPLYTDAQARRHEIRPGITGWAQVNGRNSIAWDEKFRFDVEYIDSRSFILDAKIILKTFTSVIARRGISHASHPTMVKFGEDHGE